MALSSFHNSPDTPPNFHKFLKNPKNLQKPKKTTPKNLKSFWAFLSSIFIYISIFYTFNLSPSALFFSTKFWFFISNTLILIIAADYVSFSSSKTHDYYDEYVEKSSKSPPFDDKIIFEKTKNITVCANEDEKPNEKIISMVENHQFKEDEPEILAIKDKEESGPDQETGEIEQETGEIVQETGEIEQETGEIVQETGEIEQETGEIVQETGEIVNGRKWGRSKSEVVSVGEGKVVLQRAFSERQYYEEDENEFSRMSNEELNGRVEEFIRRFNRQIRLQAVTN